MKTNISIARKKMMQCIKELQANNSCLRDNREILYDNSIILTKIKKTLYVISGILLTISFINLIIVFYFLGAWYDSSKRYIPTR